MQKTLKIKIFSLSRESEEDQLWVRKTKTRPRLGMKATLMNEELETRSCLLNIASAAAAAAATEKQNQAFSEYLVGF